MAIQTSTYQEEGQSQTKRMAILTGGGAVLGTVVSVIAGGGILLGSNAGAARWYTRSAVPFTPDSDGRSSCRDGIADQPLDRRQQMLAHDQG